MKNTLEIKRTLMGNIVPNSNVVFNVPSPFSDGITYDSVTGDIILTEIGRYAVRWWVATETALTGCIQFALKSSQGDLLTGCSPTKRGQIVGFADIEAKSKNVTLSLVNTGSSQVILSKIAPVKAALLAVKIPEDGVVPTFDVDNVETLEPGEPATADVQEDAGNPNNWLLSFGIPKGATGAAGTAPHIDAGTGNWFVGDVNSGVKAQGPTGPVGPTSAMIPFSTNKNAISLATHMDGEPAEVAYLGFVGADYGTGLYIEEGEWNTGIIEIRDVRQSGAAFIMPNDMTLKKIYLLFALTAEQKFAGVSAARPFVCLGVAKSNGLAYTILPETMTFTAPYEGNIEHPAHTVKRGSAENLNVKIAEGTLVTIFGGFICDDATEAQGTDFTISGSLYLE